MQWAQTIEKPLAKLSALTKRSSDSSNCGSNDSSATCGKPVSGNNLSLPVALGVVIPLAFAVILFLVLHRRHVKRLRNEDLNDPHKSLDFGWDPASQSKRTAKSVRKSKKIPEMTVADVGYEKGHHTRGLSMDMDIGSPYVLPPGLQGSQESLHSMSRTIHSHDDRYRPATTYSPTDAASIKSDGTRKTKMDDASSFADSSTRRGPRDEMKQDLLGNAQRMSRSMPPVNRMPDVPEIRMPEPVKGVSRKAVPTPSENPSAGDLVPSGSPADGRDSYVAGDKGGLRRSNTYLGKFIHSGNSTSNLLDQNSVQSSSPLGSGQNSTPQTADVEIAKDLPTVPPSTLTTIRRKSPPPAINTEASQQQETRPPRHQSLHSSTHPSIVQNFQDNSSDYGEHLKVDPPSPAQLQPLQHDPYVPDHDHFSGVEERRLAVDDAVLGYEIRRLSMGMRPLPPEDPADNAEQRANRIRSFYKEYFDDSKPVPGGYYEDYDENYTEGATYFDPISGQFVTAGPTHAREEPYGRQAMTPPPRNWAGRRHANTLSAGSRSRPGPRAYSSASGRFGPSGRGIPKKQLPPPGPLRVLPSPHLLKEDAFALPIDFAPGVSARDRRNGTPDSPRGGLRPYSPTVPAHMPLASSLDDLPSMPSP